ncbi:unnamed protein product (macronuclear) [Paramecium tetraurelia]|uniref:RING-type domain-containing protein n=1 Tax=Paramecium tetraurelia TaxID=5888 RepID=A0D1G8_PARTE|nr:uncharacterized protein GSPATT00012409001 [Paramecium tetraurelia]CAK76885.1 unnamed protein product [Paramecium tetraurelia]|eukprot:XP_001444282.1 hypothetical protein (macronuclear) [Paramecium tetraurelia strain d4-2]
MQEYKLINTREFPKGKLLSKEWHIRIKNGFVYVFAVDHDQDFKKGSVKLNNCILETKMNRNLKLPIKIENLKFEIVIVQDQCFLLMNGRNVEVFEISQRDFQSENRLQNPNLDIQIQEMLVVCDSILSALFDMDFHTQQHHINEQLSNLEIFLNQTQNQELRGQIQDKIEQFNQIQSSMAQQINFEQNKRQVKKQIVIKEIKDLNEEQKPQKPEIQQDTCCIICMDREITHALIPCGHQKYCEQCALMSINLQKCSICQQPITGSMKIFR